MWTFYELKTRAKRVLKESYWKSLIVVIICSVISGGITSNINFGSNNLTVTNFESLEMLSQAITNNMGLVMGMFGMTMLVSLVIGVFVTAPLAVGQIRFFNEASRGNIRIEEVLFPFSKGLKNYLNIVKISFFKTLYLVGWGFLGVVLASFICAAFVMGFSADFNSLYAFMIIVLLIAYIPMLIKSYQYMMIDYILTDEPDISRREAFLKSKQMSNGHKLRMIGLNLSFIGWILLGAVCLGVGVIFVTPYIQATMSELYLELKGERNIEFSEEIVHEFGNIEE